MIRAENEGGAAANGPPKKKPDLDRLRMIAFTLDEELAELESRP